jgi:hypothetical protein
MAMSLLQLATDAIEGIGGFDTPTAIFGNEDDTAVVLKRAAMQVGRELVRFNWQALFTPTTFTTSNGVSQYDKPADYLRPANMTFYNVTEFREMNGPYTPPVWAALTRGEITSTTLYNFRFATNYIELTPTPGEVQTIGYDYYSKSYCQSSVGTAQSEWAADSDVSRLPDDVFALGIRYRFLQRKELPYAEDKADYLEAIKQALWDDTPKGVVDVSGVPRYRISNIPSRNWG